MLTQYLLAGHINYSAFLDGWMDFWIRLLLRSDFGRFMTWLRVFEWLICAFNWLSVFLETFIIITSKIYHLIHTVSELCEGSDFWSNISFIHEQRTKAGIRLEQEKHPKSSYIKPIFCLIEKLAVAQLSGGGLPHQPFIQ